MFGLTNTGGPNLAQLVAQMQRIKDQPPITKQPAYSSIDLEILKTTYINSGAVMCQKLMPHHSMNSIHHMARRMELKNQPGWTKPEVSFLQIAINSGTALKEMVSQFTDIGFKRSYMAIKLKVRDIKATT